MCRRNSWVWVAILSVTGLSQASQAEAPKLDHCLVSLIDDVQIPAQLDGVLSKLCVREGDQVREGTPVAQADDVPAQLQKAVAVAEYEMSREQATSDVEVRYAEATRKVAAAAYQLNYDANLRVAGTKSAIELQELLLKVEQCILEIEKAKHEQKLAVLQTNVDAAKVAVADDDVQRRRICAPLDGQVVEILAHAGEWVHAGDIVVRVIRMDRLRVEGFLKVSDFSPRDVSGLAVKVMVPLTGNRSETFAGRVVFVDPRVQSGGVYQIWAEVDNRLDGNHWLLQPGLEVDMVLEAGVVGER